MNYARRADKEDTDRDYNPNTNNGEDSHDERDDRDYNHNDQ